MEKALVVRGSFLSANAAPPAVGSPFFKFLLPLTYHGKMSRTSVQGGQTSIDFYPRKLINSQHSLANSSWVRSFPSFFAGGGEKEFCIAVDAR